MALEVLVTGAAGVLGGQIVQSLKQAGHQVIASARNSGETPDVTWDVAKDYGPTSACRPDVVVHAAARTDRYQQAIAESQELFDVNVGGTVRVAGWCVSQGVKRLVLISGAIVYGQWNGFPKSETDPEEAWAAGPYAVSKLCGEKAATLILSHNIDLCVLRLSSLYGPGYTNGLPQRLLNEGRDKGVVSLSPPFDDGFDLLHISDAARTVSSAVRSGESGVWNVGSGSVTTIQDLAQSCADSVQARMEYSEGRPNRGPRTLNWVNDDKARRELGHTNDVTIRSGINELARNQIKTS